jgi:hypothetical protein
MNRAPMRHKFAPILVDDVADRDAPDTVFAGYPAGRISG